MDVILVPGVYYMNAMLSFGQSSFRHSKTEIPQMLAIIRLQDQSYWYPYTISINGETNHTCKPESIVALKPVNSISISNCTKEMSLVVNTFTQHIHYVALQMHTDGDGCSADTILFILCILVWAYTWAWAFFGLKVLTRAILTCCT